MELYLDEVGRCHVYICLVGTRYGYEDAEGVSPTEREFDVAVARRKHRLAFLKAGAEVGRHPKEVQFVAKIEQQITRRTFDSEQALTSQVYASLIRVLERDGVLGNRPFDAQPSDAAMKDIDTQRLRAFQRQAGELRKSPLRSVAAPRDVLVHLDLADRSKIFKAAVLLFGDRPKSVARSAEIKCLHYSGTEPVRPSLSQQIVGGTLPEQIDGAVEFVMARLARSVGVRESGTRAPIGEEIPSRVVSEAVINAGAHRDYTASSAVQVTVFSDRVEVSNPGELPRGLTPDQLRRAHPSIPRNPLITEVLYLSGYVEGAGSGTLDMIARCREAQLPEPDFRQEGDQWIVTLWRDWLTPGFIAMHQLNDRQVQGLTVVREKGRVTNASYRVVTGAIAKTAGRDLDELVSKGVLRREGAGRGAYYVRGRANGT